MHKRFLSLLFLLFSFAASGQAQTGELSDTLEKKLTETEILQTQAALEKAKQAQDSLHALLTPLYWKSDSLKRLLHYNRFTPQYSAILFGVGLSQARLSALNTELSREGFEAMRDQFVNIDWGITERGKRWMQEYHIQILLRNKTESGDLKVKLQGANFSYHVGYDLLNTRAVQFYPIAGLYLEPMTLSIQQQNHSQSTYDGVLQVAEDFSTTTLTRTSFGANVGAQLDFRLNYPYDGPGIILSLRAGLTQPFVEGKYRVDQKRQEVDLPIKLQHTFFALVLKLYGVSQL